MSNLSRFLVDLATNADFKRRYTEDPEGAFAAAGLTATERAALASGDSVLMRSALGKPDNECMSQTGNLALPPGTIVTTPDGKATTLTEEAILRCKDDRLPRVPMKQTARRARTKPGKPAKRKPAGRAKSKKR